MDIYVYKANVTKVYDGDTITCDIDCGFGVVLMKQKIRLYGLNAPEVRGDSKEQGIITRDKLRERILDKEIRLKTIKDKKAMAKIEPIMAVYPKIGFLEFVEMTSDVIPNAGKITI